MLPAAAAALGSVALPASAEAAFTTAQCGNTASAFPSNNIADVGSSLQKVVQNGLDGTATDGGWAFDFSNDANSVCSSPFDQQTIKYPGGGSGAGNNAMCSNGGADVTLQQGRPYDVGAVDDPPTATQISNADNCSGVSGNSQIDGGLELHTIPVAQAAIAIVVHLPTGCTIASADNNAATKDRFDMLNQNLEAAFENGASAPTWSQLLPNSPSCTGPVTRVVRYDQSGTTYQTENYFAAIAGAEGNTSEQDDWILRSLTSAQSENWPNNGSNIVYGGTTAGHGDPGVCTLTGPGNTPPASESAAQTSDCNGAGNEAGAVLDTPGSVGYVDLATADTVDSAAFAYPSKGTGTTFWVPVQNNGVSTKGAAFQDPQVTQGGYVDGTATGGASCIDTSYTPPTGNNDPTLSDWSEVFGGNPNQGSNASNYPLCTLTYALAFNDETGWLGNTAAGDARARNVKDFLTYQLANTDGTDGQNELRSLDYDALPSNILTISRNAVSGITWSGSA